MRLAMRERFGIPRQRGFWLRCFLGGVIWICAFAAGSDAWGAQLDVPGPEHLTRVEGLVVNSSGKPVAGVEVTLVRDDTVAYRTRTDQSGAFRFEHVSGRYTFRVARSDNAPAAREIVVTEEIVTRVERKKLYVILGPGACMDECSSVLTSKREFERSLRQKNRH
jgi:hypothetical protein